MEATEGTVLIIGAGIFGTSTAYYLSERIPPSNITIIDQHPYPTPEAASNSPPYGASHDINKIVRSDYTIPFYMELAEEALAVWSSWDLVKPFYHRSGWIALNKQGSNFEQAVRRNYRDRPGADPTQSIEFDSVRSNWGGILQDVDVSSIDSAYYNSSAGWAEADKAVAVMLDASVQRGVRYCQGRLQELILGERSVRGAKLQDGKTLRAGKVVLATGAWTSEVMASIEDQLEIEASERLENQVKGCGVCCAHFALSDQEKKKFENMPVVVYGSSVEILPPPKSDFLKFTNPVPFWNPKKLPSGRQISAPWGKDQNNVPEKLKTETLRNIEHVVPEFGKGRKVDYWRMCWDLVTPEQHQLITAHPNPNLTSLYLAVGGSFHSWKFLPVIGKYVANVILGQSNGSEKDKNWAWKSKGWESAGPGAHEKVTPNRTLQDIVAA